MILVRRNRTKLRRSVRRKGNHSYQPLCLALEHRTLLASMQWDVSVSGDWDVASNWVSSTNPSDHHVPTASDDAVINQTSVTVTHSAGSDIVQSIASSDNLTLSGGALTVTGNLQISAGSALSLTGGTLAGATVTSGTNVSTTVSGGTLSSVTFATGSTLNGSQSPAGLVAFYNFDNGPNDVSGNGNNGTLSSNPPTLTSAGYHGGAYQFTIANQNSITVPININPTAMPQLTMGGWFDAANANTNQGGLLSDDNGGFDRTIDIDTRNGGVKWSAFNGTGVVSGAAVVPNQWVFVAVRYDQTTGAMSLDVNGTMTNSSTHFGASQLATLSIGRNPSFAAWFSGKIDDVFVYNQYLTDAQLNKLQVGTYANVSGGLTLNGTAELGGAGGGTNARLYFQGNQSLSGMGTVNFGAAAGNGLFAQGDNASNPTTLTIGAGIAINGGSGAVTGYYSNDAVVLDGRVASTTAGEIVSLSGGAGRSAPTSSNAGPLLDQGSLDLGRTEVFTLASDNGKGTGVVQTPNQTNPSTFDIAVNVVDPSTVFTLINSQYGVLNDTVGAVEFKATGGLDYTVNLVEGQDIRDHNNGGYNNTIGQGSLGGDYVGTANYGGGQVRFDEQQFVLPFSFKSATLTDIILHGYGNNPNGQPFLAAATVENSNGQNPIALSSYVNSNVRSYANGFNYPFGGSLVTTGKGLINVAGGLTLAEQAGLSISTNSAIRVSGDLLGTTTNASEFNPVGTVVLDSTTASVGAPQLLEAMSQDMGSNFAGFSQNFAYGTLTLGSGDYVELVDQSANSPGVGAEAVYANSLVISPGTTLNLNGLNLYVNSLQNSGAVTGGSITQIPKSAALTIDSPTATNLSFAGELEDWTFFDRGGNTVTVSLDPGSGTAGGPSTPYLEWAQVELIDPTGKVLKSITSTVAGAILKLSNVALPVDGTYTIAVMAAPSQETSVGNYVVAAYDVTPNIQSLNVNQVVTGNLPTPYSIDQWTFAASANTQIKFLLQAESASGLAFSLTGPNGFNGFTNITGNSSLITLPTSGIYALTAQSTGGATGSFAFEVAQTTQTSLSLGTPFSGAFAGSGQPQLFAVNVPTAAPLSLQLTDSTTTDQVELYAQFGTPPTRQVYGEAANGSGASQSLLIPSADAGTWYVLVFAESASAGSTFTLVANATPLVVTAVTPVKYGQGSVATLTLTGAGFTNSTSIALVATNGTTTYPAASVAFDTFTLLTATVNLAGVPQGVYSVRAANGSGGSETLAASFTVTAAGQANLVTHLILPGALGRHQAATLYIQYANTGTVAMPAPVLLLESTVADDKPRFTLNPALLVSGLWTTALGQGYSNTMEILASGSTPGVLEPGESMTVPIYYAGMQQPWNFSEPQFHFDIRIFTTSDSDTVNWSSLQSSLQPAGLTSAAWSVVYGNLTAQLGNTWGGYVQFLDNEAAYLGQLGENVTDISRLWGLGVQQANNTLTPVGPSLTSATDDSVAIPGALSLSFTRLFSSSISGRNTLGPLGYGWSTPWQTTATVASDGTVTVTGADGSQRVFQPDSRTAGTYFSQPGDTGTLKADGQGGYLLTEADGMATDYNSKGALNSLQDTNGNRITAGYTSGQLTTLTASSGQSITIAYNVAGLISKVTDSLGRVTTYSYDVRNQYLMAVKAFNGQTTSYAYNNPILIGGSVVPKSYGALLSITFPGGTGENFSYNTDGWLTGTSSDGGAQPQSYAYALGRVSVTNGTGSTSQVYYNEDGLVVKSVDPLGNVTLNTYDGNFKLVEVTNALGQSESYNYNAAGQVTSSTDFLGSTTHFAYSGAFNELASMTDANGNTTKYSYSSAGDLLSTTYAGGTTSSSTYDPEGDALSFVNANGQPIQYTYNAAGQTLSETFADGSSYSFTYDNFENLLTATDATGTTTFTYDPTTQLLTKVAYPNGTYLTFTYNAAGQRTSMVDQTGFTVNYRYDSLGRLSQLTDASGNRIVTYTYDADGRLTKKVNGNGTYTTYQYDADGNIQHLVNYAPGGSVNSRFDYTYNALGLETTEATVDGTWTYSYDADGQLVHAVFASTNPSVPNQGLAYSYDAMGNRVTTVINGVATSYMTNDMNEYTSVGGVKQTYDADGNLLNDGTNIYTYNALNQLTSVTGPSGETTYTYNALSQQAASMTNGQTSQNLIDPSGLGNLVGQYTGSGTLVADYTYGLGLTSQITPGGTSYYDFDGLGSTNDVTGSTGSLSASYLYATFGQVIFSQGTISNPFQFGGQSGAMQQANGTDDMGARFYAPAFGRFDSEDPLRLAGGSLNFFEYADNSPLQMTDPTGLTVRSVLPQRIGDYNPSIPGPAGQIWDGLGLIGSGFIAAAAAPGAGWVFGAIEAGAGFIDIFAALGAYDSPSDSPSVPQDPSLNVEQAVDQETGPAVSPGASPPWVVELQLWQDQQQEWRAEYPIPDGVGGFQGDGYYPPPVPPGGSDGGQGATGAPNEHDPNVLIGPAGYGTSNFVAPNGTSFPYEILFENSPSATAPAQEVTITEQLDPNLNWTTFQFTSIGWGNTNLSIPDGSQHYETTVSVTDNGESFDVDVEASFDLGTGLIIVNFQSIDPDTQLPPDVLSGFLPPEDGTGRGMGFVNYLIQPLANLSTGAQIRAIALVTFGINATIATDQVDDEDPTKGIDPAKQAPITIDSGPPTSSVSALPATSTATGFTVNMTGTDDSGGSGIGSFALFVSTNGGPFVIDQSNIPAQPGAGGTYTGTTSFDGKQGDTYAFYSVATDNVGNVQPTPNAAGAHVLLVAAPTSSVSELPAITASTSFTLNWSGISGAGATSITHFNIFVSDNGGPFQPFLQDTNQSSATFTGQAGHTYGFYSVATDNFGDTQATPSSAQAQTTIQLPAPPVIISEKAIIARKTNNKGKPAGKPVLQGFTLQFSEAMGRSAGDAAEYTLEKINAKATKKKPAKLGRIPFTVTYSPAADTVTVSLSGNQTFPLGGLLELGKSVASDEGALLSGKDTFVIGKGGKTIQPQ